MKELKPRPLGEEDRPRTGLRPTPPPSPAWLPVQDLGVGVWVSGLRGPGSGVRVQGLGFRGDDLGFRI